MKNAIISTLLVILSGSPAFSQDLANDYIATKETNASILKKYKYEVEFKKRWVYSPSKKTWVNKNNESLSALELLKQKKIKIKPLDPSKVNKVFVYVWDENKKKIRIICTGFGIKNRNMK